MFDIEFDRMIGTGLDADELWRLMKEAFENPATSPIWPVELDEVHPVTLQEGTTVRATYALGPIKNQLSYRITEFRPGHRFSYESSPDHPLAGGATVEVAGHDEGSTLRWSGRYRPRLHLAAPVAWGFVRWYFVDAFFGRLRENLRRYEEQHRPRKGSRRPFE